MTSSRRSASVLLVDDNPRYREAYARWLDPDHTVTTAQNGGEALARVDNDTDVVILDRRMPDLAGEEVLREIRRRGIDCRVALVTGVAPEIDIVEMEIDDYLVKPITEAELTGLVEQLLLRDQFRSEIQDGFALVSKKAVLESTYSAGELKTNDAYHSLLTDLEAVETTIISSVDDLIASGNATAAYRELPAPANHNQHPIVTRRQTEGKDSTLSGL